MGEGDGLHECLTNIYNGATDADLQFSLSLYKIISSHTIRRNVICFIYVLTPIKASVCEQYLSNIKKKHCIKQLVHLIGL